MILRVAPRRALQLGLDQREALGARLLHRPLEGAGATAVVDRLAEAGELVRGRVVPAGAHEQPVERELHVVGARAAIPERDSEMLLDRRAHVEARVVVRAEEARLA